MGSLGFKVPARFGVESALFPTTTKKTQCQGAQFHLDDLLFASIFCRCFSLVFAALLCFFVFPFFGC